MSRYFGPIRQNGYVVEDLDAALHHWTRVLGVGPFFKIDRLPLDYFEYQGVASPLQVAVAVGFSGGLQIELVHQLNDAPSHYIDFIRQHGYGLQHLGMFSTSYDQDLVRLQKSCKVAARGKVRNGPRFVYYDTGSLAGTMAELADFIPEMATRAAFMEQAAAGWNGEDPVRPFAASAA